MLLPHNLYHVLAAVNVVGVGGGGRWYIKTLLLLLLLLLLLFAAARLRLWNTLPLHVRLCNSLRQLLAVVEDKK